MSGVATLFARPAQAIALSFASAIAVGTILLSLPLATAEGDRAPFVDALFTATSAICVTGLVVVDTGSYWSPFGQVVITLLIQAGGLGIMALATLIAIVFFRRMGLQSRMAAQAETKSVSATDLRRIIKRIVLFSILVETILAMLLTARFLTAYDMNVTEALPSGIFHAISAFNNAGFSLYSDNLIRFAADGWVLLSVAAAVIIGGLGFPVVFELRSNWRRPTRWSILTRVTVVMTLLLLVIGTVVFLASESDNARTWGGKSPGQQILSSFFTAVMPRTAGFNIIDVGAMESESLVLTDLLMFIGGGSAGTAGGVKITTLGILLFIVWAELRGRPDVEIGRKRVSTETQRQALTIVFLSLGIVTAGTILLILTTPFTFEQSVFEAISAFGTVGLSTGITSSLPDAAKYSLILLMFAGRIGPLTFASALAARSTTRVHRRPEERMSIG
jgi:trk system potassium uptake protein TrkH